MLPLSPVINSTVYQGITSPYIKGQNVVTSPNIIQSSAPIIPAYANATEVARAILTDQPFIATNPETGETTVQTVNPSPPIIPTVTITDNTSIGDWIKANPMMAAGGAGLLLYTVYLLTKKTRR